MSKHLTALIVGSVASLALVVGTMQGCGGGSGSNNTALCEQGCDKLIACTPNPTAIEMQALAACKPNCASQVPTTHC